MTLEISKLSNGLTVVSDPMPGLESAAVGIWVNTGSRNEQPHQMGVSHMLEHMAFKGTARRSARAIAEEIEAVGGVLNAYTSREQTAFHARGNRIDLKRQRCAVEIRDAGDSPHFLAGSHNWGHRFRDRYPFMGLHRQNVAKPTNRAGDRQDSAEQTHGSGSDQSGEEEQDT